MVLRRERGQERPEKRTVGNSQSTKRPRINKNESKGEEKNYGSGRTGAVGPRIGKSRSSKFEVKDANVGRETRTVKKISTRSATKPRTGVVRPGGKEKTSDIFRRNVIQRKVVKEPERAESDQYMNREGNVLRGRFGRQKLHDQITNPSTRPSVNKTKNSETIRLNRYIANAGLCSRREADTFISTGCVSVNGKIVSEMGYQVKPGDSVSFNGKIISTEKKVYLLLNKPKGFVTTLEDPHADKTVMDLVKSACSERIYPVGRLDKNTTGLLLFTNDGDLTKRLTHPKYNRKKIYHVFLDQRVTKEHLQLIVDGVTLEDGFVAADSVSYVSEDDKKQVGIEIHSGKNKIVRRIFESLGYKVIKLDRVYFCGLTKKNLPRGKWRFLSQDEVNLLKMSSM
jgi:23S rRNA pseudouridine2605 synthase